MPNRSACASAGPLAAGSLSRADAERMLVTSALPHEASPEQLTWDYAVKPTTEAYWVGQGYGVVDAAARDRALAVLLGAAEPADRSDVDQWMQAQDAVRDAYFGAP